MSGQPARVIGHVDGFVGGTLRGWVINLDDQRTPEPVVLEDDRGGTFSVVTHYHRPDVCQAYNMRGLFGFAVKRDWLDSRSQTVTIRSRTGAVLTMGARLALPPPTPGDLPPQGPLDIFLHLAKTAGTSARHVLTSQLSDAEILLVYPGDESAMPESLIRTIPLHQRQRLRLAIGHCSYGIHERFAVPSHYSVFLRDPVTRLRSNIAHHGVAHTALQVGGVAISLADAVNAGLAEEFDNLAVRVVAGLSRDQRAPNSITSADVELALRNIREHFKFVGLYETMAESFDGLCDAMGLQRRRLPMDNVTPVHWMGEENILAAIRWDVVHDRNRHDFALYDAVQRAGLIGRIN